MKKIALIAAMLIMVMLFITPALAKNKCVTLEGDHLAAITESLLNQAHEYLDLGDVVALHKLLDTKRVIFLKPGVTVYIEEGPWHGGNIKMRPIGFTFEIWTRREAIKCTIKSK